MRSFTLRTLLMGVLVASARIAYAEDSLEYQVKVQSACEVAFWAMPAVSVYDIELSIKSDLGGKFGDVAYFTKPMTARHGFLTANDVTPYVVGVLSCREELLG